MIFDGHPGWTKLLQAHKTKLKSCTPNKGGSNKAQDAQAQTNSPGTQRVLF